MGQKKLLAAAQAMMESFKAERLKADPDAVWSDIEVFTGQSAYREAKQRMRAARRKAKKKGDR